MILQKDCFLPFVYIEKSQNHPQMKSVFFQKEHEMLQSMCRGDVCLNQEKEKGLWASYIKTLSMHVMFLPLS
jgi:hypothetical protein